jgi:hypothetical protein
MSVQTKLEPDAVLAAKTTTKIPKAINPAEIRTANTLSIFLISLMRGLAQFEPAASRGCGKVGERLKFPESRWLKTEMDRPKHLSCHPAIVGR